MSPDVELAPGIRAGQILDGKYCVERVLGRGGMGVVVCARQLERPGHVAIKFLLPGAMRNRDAVLRFEQEARAAARIKGEHVARVVDVGKLQSGAPYFVMEYLEGKDLAALLAERGRLYPDDAIDYVLQACEAIAQAHALAIVHRDLKPANLFLTYRPDGSPCIKVLDFGISKVVSIAGAEKGHVLTSTAAVMGSPLYMSPEQLLSARDVDQRTDIWALGCILFELITGRTPFRGRNLPEMCLLIQTTGAPPLHTLRPGLPLELGNVLARCLSKRREDRFDSVPELAAQLSPFAPVRSHPSAARIAQFAGARTAAPAFAPGVTLAETIGELELPRRPRERPRFLLAGALCAFVLGLAALGFAFWSKRGGVLSPPVTATDGPRTAPTAAPSQSERALKLPALDPKAASAAPAVPSQPQPAPSLDTKARRATPTLQKPLASTSIEVVPSAEPPPAATADPTPNLGSRY